MTDEDKMFDLIYVRGTLFLLELHQAVTYYVVRLDQALFSEKGGKSSV